MTVELFVRLKSNLHLRSVISACKRVVPADMIVRLQAEAPPIREKDSIYGASKIIRCYL